MANDTEQWQLLSSVIVNSVLLWNIASCRCWKQNSEPKQPCFGDSCVIRSIYLFKPSSQCFGEEKMLWCNALGLFLREEGAVRNHAKILSWLHNYRQQRASQASALKAGLMLRLRFLVEGSFLHRMSPKEELTFNVPGHVKHGQWAKCRPPELRAGTAKDLRGKKFI